MMTAARSPLPLELDAFPSEIDKLKQNVERLDKFLRIRILRGSPEEEVGEWSDHCLHHEESFTDKRHDTIIVAPGHRDLIKNVTTDALQMGTALIMVPADGCRAKSRDRQHSRLINTLGVRQTRIGVKRIECDAASCKQERYFEDFE